MGPCFCERPRDDLLNPEDKGRTAQGQRRGLAHVAWLCRAGPWVLAFATAYVMVFKTKKNSTCGNRRGS